MPPETVLVDSSFLYALYNRNEIKHQQARDFALSSSRTQFIIPQIVLPEVAYLFNRKTGTFGVIKFLRTLIALHPYLEPMYTPDDLVRAEEVMADIPAPALDFVDCCIMAMSERLKVTQICTFDRRDFSRFQPRHAPYLELLP
jgi:predicted nucleic acid-binding protein